MNQKASEHACSEASLTTENCLLIAGSNHILPVANNTIPILSLPSNRQFREYLALAIECNADALDMFDHIRIANCVVDG